MGLGMVASSMGGAGAGALASAYMNHRMRNLSSMDPKQYGALVKQVAGVDVPVEKYDMDNAYFNPGPYPNGEITLGSGGFGSASVLAHEAGHARIEQNPGILRFLQRRLYGLSPLTGIAAPAAGLAAGAALKNPWQGALAGAGLGAIINSGYLIPEGMASHHAVTRAGKGNGGHEWDISPGALRSAFLTYLAAGVAPSAIAGLAGGWAGRRHQRYEQDKEKKKRLIRATPHTMRWA